MDDIMKSLTSGELESALQEALEAGREQSCTVRLVIPEQSIIAVGKHADQQRTIQVRALSADKKAYDTDISLEGMNGIEVIGSHRIIDIGDHSHARLAQLIVEQANAAGIADVAVAPFAVADKQIIAEKEETGEKENNLFSPDADFPDIPVGMGR